ncbi:capsule assembly Wzi family protein [Candidatus Marinimicrobia bacterium]|nr:capsule assembly Wzi family protein [Candidatus Neomarinimicrobiota bacterium]
MKLYFLIIFFLALAYPQSEIKISLDIKNNKDIDWWSKYNNNGIAFKKNSIYSSYNKQINNSKFFLSLHASTKKILIGESYFSQNISKENVIKLGRYYRDFSKYLNDDLSSGSMLISTNAQPLPKLGFVGEYQLKNNNKVSFNYGVSHALLGTNSTYNKSPYIHGKFIYINNKKDNREFGIGFVHEAIWGGSSSLTGKFPSTFNDFLKVVISADGEKKEGQPHANALGNHLGIWDFYYIKNFKINSFKIYYQHLFEDTSGLRFANKLDGLWGIEYQDFSRKINFLLEFINTSNQDRNPPYVDEAYYNHSEYTLGWSYNGYVIGNPFLNNITPNPSKVVHFGMNSFENNKYPFKVLLSRKVDINDSLKYSINFGKNFDNFLFLLFINKEEEKKNMGIKISYNL